VQSQRYSAGFRVTEETLSVQFVRGCDSGERHPVKQDAFGPCGHAQYADNPDIHDARVVAVA